MKEIEPSIILIALAHLLGEAIAIKLGDKK